MQTETSEYGCRSHPVSGFILCGEEKRPNVAGELLDSNVRLTFHSISGLSSRRETTRMLFFCVFFVFSPGRAYVLKVRQQMMHAVPLKGWWDLQLECTNHLGRNEKFSSSKRIVSSPNITELHKAYEFWHETSRPLQSHESRLPLRGHFRCRPFHLVANALFPMSLIFVFIIRRSIFRMIET